MPYRRFLPFIAVAAVAVLASPGTAAAADPGPPPSSMASLGDSITRGFNACGFYVDCTSRSWSTGDNSTVNSHYLRIRAKNPAINGRNFNDARSGAQMDALAGQAGTAVSQGVEYVTILLGANDACASTEAGMTSVAQFRSELDAGLARLKAGLPSARLLVLSVPDLKRLWQIGKDNGNARFFWSLGGICQSMLANPTSTAPADEARRDRVRQRVIDFNGQLAAACATYGSTCRFDGNGVFNFPFTLSQVSGWDYFHPNSTGQRMLAELSYQIYGW